jgi:hypothetical protein
VSHVAILWAGNPDMLSSFNDISSEYASVPEPSTLVLASIACTIVGVWRLRRRRVASGGAA